MQPFFYEFKSNDLQMEYRETLQFPKHLHQHIELVIMKKGETMAYADGKGGLLGTGQAFITFPNQVHHYIDDRGAFGCYLFIFSPEILPAFQSLFRKKVPENPIIPVDLPEVLPILEALAAESPNTDQYARPAVEGGLAMLLAHIFRRTQWEDVDQRNINALRAVLDYCNAHYTENISLEDVARNTHRSKYYISHVFSGQIGMTLPAYLNMLRIHDAKEMLRDPQKSVTDVAYAVGFSSLRSFNRCFLSLTGQSPSAFRRSNENA